MYDRSVDRSALVLVMTLLAGCESVLELDHVPDPHGFTPCADQAPALLCADFDEPSPVVYEEGIAGQLPVADPGASFAVRGPASSGANALWVTATTGRYFLSGAGGAPVSHLHASFDLLVTEAPDNAYEVVRIGISNTDACAAYIQVNAPNINLMAECGSTRNMVQVLGALPTSWTHWELDYDPVSTMATLAVNGGTPAMVVAPESTTGPPLAKAGLLYTNGKEEQVGLDNLVVTADP